jgi:hypothetical protein
MEKLQTAKASEEERLREVVSQPGVGDLPVELGSYQRLLDHLQQMAQDAGKPETRSQIIQKLIHKIEIKPEGFRLHYFTSQDRLMVRLGLSGRARRLCGRTGVE